MKQRRLGLVAIVCVAIGSGLVMQASGWAQTSNYSLVRALYNGTATIDPWHWETKDESWYRGHYYSVKAPVLPALTLPVYAVVKAAGGDRWAYEVAKSARSHQSWRWRPTATPQALYGQNRLRTYRVRGRIEQSTAIIWVLGLFGNVLPALGLMLLVRWAADRVEPGYGTAAAITLGLATMILPFSTLYFSHVLAALLGFAAFALLLRERDGPPRRKLVAVAGLLAGLAFSTEYPLAFAGAVVGVYAISRARDRVRRGLAYAAGCVAGAIPLFAYNLAAFGSLTHFSYSGAVEKQGRTGHDVLGSNDSGFFGIGVPSPKVALELLFSSKGLLILTPVLAMGVVGAVLLYRRGRRAEALTIAAVAAVYLVYNSGYWLPYGGGTPGPRFLVPVLPFLALPLALAWRRFPAVTLALAVPSALFMFTATLTFPLIGNDDVGFWWKLVDAQNFVATVATPLGAGHHWAGIAPVLIAAAAAAVLAAAATPAVSARFGAGRAALALVAWVAAALAFPWILGADQSVLDGDTGALRLIAIFGAAGLAVVGVAAALRARRQAVDDQRSAPLAAEA